jgi:hypothetical protein
MTEPDAPPPTPVSTDDDRPHGPGRPPLYPPEHFAEVAQVYSQAYRSHSRNPTLTVSKEFQVSRSTAAKWVARARKLGFLHGTRQRVAGGVPSAPTHAVGLAEGPSPPHVRFSRTGVATFTVWVMQPPGAQLRGFTDNLSKGAGIIQNIHRRGLARSLVDYFGYELDEREDELLARFSRHETGPEFWKDVDDAGLLADETIRRQASR